MEKRQTERLDLITRGCVCDEYTREKETSVSSQPPLKSPKFVELVGVLHSHLRDCHYLRKHACIHIIMPEGEEAG